MNICGIKYLCVNKECGHQIGKRELLLRRL